jgi:hypothetical protein
MHLPKYTQARRCDMAVCVCGEDIEPPLRVELMKEEKKTPTCLKCGEVNSKKVKHCIAPINKSNYMFISDMETLKQLNPKRTT